MLGRHKFHTQSGIRLSNVVSPVLKLFCANSHILWELGFQQMILGSVC